MRNYDIMAAYSGKMKMQGRKKVYVETSVISNLTARRSSRVADALMQITTEAWWEMASIRYSLFYSSVVVDEASRGNPEAAQRRLEALKGLIAIEYDDRAVDLANRLLRSTAVPKNSFNDAMHIAIAAVNEMDILVTWNCTHIANVETMPTIRQVCETAGYRCPEICTPYFMEGGMQ